MFGGWFKMCGVCVCRFKMCGVCVCTFWKLLKCQKYTSEKMGQVFLFITTLGLMFYYWKETTSTFLKNNNAFFRLAFTSLMLLKKLLNNLPICVEVLLNFIWTHVSIKVNVFIQKNAYYNHNYVHKSMEKYLVQDKYSFSS